MIPITARSGNARTSNPFNTKPIKNNGKNTREKTILEIPHVALIANERIFPNVIIIKIKNRNINMCGFPPLC